MIKIYVKKQSNYPVSTPELKKHLRDFLKDKGIVSDTQVSVALVGERQMLDLAKKYLEDNRVHNVLSFPADEVKGKFVYPPDGVIRLGEIVICYPRAFEEAKKEGKGIDEKVVELVEHGAMHLMGIHNK